MNDASAIVMPVDMHRLLDAQRAAFERDRLPSAKVRIDRIDRVIDMTEKHRTAVIRAIDADFGGRSAHETMLGDLFAVIADAKHTRRHLRSWMTTKRVPTRIIFRPGRNRLMRQPLGVVGIVSPWNYPYFLSMAPAIGALAAGNRVMLKPSELSPRFSELLAHIVADSFAPEEVTVVQGDGETGRAFCDLPFDHLLFTGSTAVGRKVALAAARNLTPVTLELGGKSPAIIDETANLTRSIERLAIGKLFNAGQTCVAPDYLLLHESHMAQFEPEFRAFVTKAYPTLASNTDYTSIISERHSERLRSLIEDARSKGARIVPLHESGDAASATRRIVPPMLLFGADDHMKIMQEEIFGPLLPVRTYRKLDEAIAYVNARDRPLSLYWFGENATNRDRVLRSTISGGVTVNDCMWHILQNDSPFGGAGASGIGAYHGEYGFRTFSKDKPVFVQSRFAMGFTLWPPYGRKFERIEALLRWFA